MASDDPNRQENVPPAPPPEAPVSPAAIEAAVARLSPESAANAPFEDKAAEVPPEASSSPEIPSPETPYIAPSPVLRERSGPSPWLALPIGAFAGALASVIVAYSLVDTGIIKPAPSTDLQPLLQRMNALEARPRTDPAANVAQGITQVEAALSQMDARLAKAEAATAPIGELQRALASAQGDVAALKQGAQALTAAAAQSAAQSAALGPQLSALSAQIADVRKRTDEVAAAATALDRATAALVVLSALRDAVLSGRPFSAELDAARAVLGPTAGSLDPFMPNAGQGYAPPAKLAQRLVEAAQAPAAPAPTDAASTAGSIVDRILSSAENLVKVRPAESGPGKESQVALDAAVAAVRAGDLDLALKQIDTLPADTKARLKGITAEITARRDAANTASALYQQALAAISGKVP